MVIPAGALHNCIREGNSWQPKAERHAERFMNPREIVQQIEATPVLPGGGGDRFTGYAVMGLPFRSGHVLALRRFPASSIGPGYTSVWHRDPRGDWTFYSTIQPDL